MKLSVILSAKSDIACEIEDKIESLGRDLKSNTEYYNDSEMPPYVVEDNEKLSLKIKYYESILKVIADLK